MKPFPLANSVEASDAGAEANVDEPAYPHYFFILRTHRGEG